MRIHKIFTILMAFLMVGGIPLPTFAEDNNMLDRNELNNTISQEIQQINIHSERKAGNYLQEHALDFLDDKNVYKVTYMAYDKNVYMSYSIKDSFKAEYILYKSKYGHNLLSEIKLPSYPTQFKIMSELIANNDNDTLKNLLDKGYDPRLWVFIHKPGETSIRNLFTQAILSNNKGAIDIIYKKIKENCIGIYEYIDNMTTTELLLTELCYTLYNLIRHKMRLSRTEVDKMVEERVITINPSTITSRDIRNVIIEGDKVGWFAIGVIFKNIPEEEQEKLLINAVYELIDYRIEQGY